jgi:LPS export ABC transporter permease LptG/LPS export ABC transporter permease LptF
MLVSVAMRKLDKLLYFAIIPPFLITLIVLTFFIYMQELGRLSEMLITGNASIRNIAVIAGSLAPGVLIFSLPLSFLIGCLIGLSGLSGEYQVTALRACGIPLRQLLRPIMVVASAVGLATALMALVILPKTNDILFSMKSLISIRQASSLIAPRVFNEDFDRVVFYLDDLSIDRQYWERVFLADSTNPKTPRIVIASEGTWVTDPSGFRLQLHLQNGMIYEVNQQDPAKDNTSVFSATDIPIELKAGHDSGANPPEKKPANRSTRDLWKGTEGANAAQWREEKVELHKRLALPCSVFGFALVAVALGTFSRQSGRTSGAVLSLLLALLYYVLFGNGFRLAMGAALPPWLGLWSADFILMAIGILLFINAEQNSRLTQLAAAFHYKSRVQTAISRLHLGTIRQIVLRLDKLAITTTGKIARSRFPRVLDAYISKGFHIFFLWSVIVCYSLFVILTLFDLLDEIIRNNVAWPVVSEYFVFLTPQILLLCVPMAILLAILILFGVLEKGSEVTAMKAGGWSLYRIAVPVFLLAGILCGAIYFLQDYVLPYANIRQDALRLQIKGRPPQTTSKPRKWILGQENRIYNYDYFNPDNNVFVGLNIYEADLRQHALKRRIYAAKATIQSPGRWQLENGWIRDFESTRDSFRTVNKEVVSFPEPAEYFKKEIFAPGDAAKMTYLELRNYIDYLRQSGYNATELQVQLYMKISFPLSCFVMALLGVPFSFFMGKRGAFFGITASIFIAIVYWGIFRIFEQMGAYGLLNPVLAAWSPNLLFGAAGLGLLFTIKT